MCPSVSHTALPVETHQAETVMPVGIFRDAQMQKVPYMYVMGDKEIESQGVAVRKRGGENLGLKSFEEVKTALIDEIQRKV